MKFTQYYLDCLSHASYLIGDETTGRAVVVDPRRDVQVYLDDAAAAGLRIELVIETHFHADFLSGHLELAQATGAEIAYGEAAKTEFPVRPLADGETIPLGEITLKVLATPGHTPESISVLVYEHAGDEVPYGVLTGDTLFIGDVGRPDLLGSLGFTAEEMGRKLYNSLHTQLMPLPDATRVFPAHGAGSSCGKQLSTETVSTLGEQRHANYALATMTEDEFVAIVTDGQPSQPEYFVYDAVLNRKQRPLLDQSDPLPQLTLDEALAAQAEGVVLLDTRDAGEYGAGHLPGSVWVGLDGRFAEQAGSVVAHDATIVLVSEPGTEDEARVRLARIGFDNVRGFLADPLAAIAAQPDKATHSSRVTAEQLDRLREEVNGLVVLDVRNPGETALGTVEGAVLMPLAKLNGRMGELDTTAPVVVVCASGRRSLSAASLLSKAGFGDVSDLLGGYTGYVASTRSAAAAG
ncbi:MAG: MBL fold metallo-hydrolase [Actinobacteria bacterium]|nr:MBL fold metallo-hydrolase [Actinomycetota bacterium]MBI3686419.1 MBL fold metallo-hydrolase [Actinomycetota bacterium]